MEKIENILRSADGGERGDENWAGTWISDRLGGTNVIIYTDNDAPEGHNTCSTALGTLPSAGHCRSPVATRAKPPRAALNVIPASTSGACYFSLQ